jgi:hypothetical protein
VTTPIPDTDALLELVYAAIDEYNASASVPVPRAPDSLLYGSGGSVDSLGLVHLIIALEQHLLERTGLSMALAEDRAFSPTRSPFRDVTTLVLYLRQRLEASGP